MSVINITGFLLASIVWHEFGHFIAAERFKAVEYIAIIRSKHPLGKWFLFGPAIGTDDDKLTDRQLWVCLLAPLAWAIPALVLLGVNLVVPHGVFVSQALVWGMAAGFVLISDIPQYFTLGLEESEYDHYMLWRAEGRYG